MVALAAAILLNAIRVAAHLAPCLYGLCASTDHSTRDSSQFVLSNDAGLHFEIITVDEKEILIEKVLDGFRTHLLR